MKRNLIKQVERIKHITYLLEMLANRTELSPLRLLSKILYRLDKDLSRIEGRILRIEINWNKKITTGKGSIPGASQEWYGFNSPYRCWACLHLGKCENPFANRPACSSFIFNDILQNNTRRSMKYMQGAKMKRLNPPLILSYAKHLEKCRVCARVKSTKRIPANKRTMKHYIQYKNRRAKKLLSFLSYFGIPLQDFIWKWEC